jgi:tellurite resistance protein
VPVRASARKHRLETAIPYVEEPGWGTVAGIVTAGAMMACADGRPDRVERSRLLSFLSRRGLLPRFRRQRVIAAFDDNIARMRTRSVEELGAAADSLKVLAASSAASLVATAAAHVALADGIASAQELVVLRMIRDRLGLAAAPER